MNVKIIPAVESATSTLAPFVYRGPSSAGKRYPEPILDNGQSWSHRVGETTYATACAQATARGTATARRDSLPALLADQVTISGVQTDCDG